MDLNLNIFLLLVFSQYLITTGECETPIRKIEDIFGRLGPTSLLTTFTKYANFSEYTEQTCGGQFLVYTNSLRRGEMWALKMIDSSSKIPSGILTGNIIDLGMFDECMSVQAKKEKIKIRGRHCMYSITFANHNTSSLIQPTFSICVPSACNAYDVETFINKTIHNIEWVKDLGITDITASCSTVGPQRWSNGTIISVSNPLESAVANNLAEFSLCKSANKIFNMNANPNSLTALIGIRSLSMCWIVLGHQYVMRALYVNVNLNDIEDWMKSWKTLYIYMSVFAVDTFFMLSGLLVAYLFLKEMSTGKKFNIFAFYFHRYIRLTLPVVALLVFSIFIIPLVGSGPRWEKLINIFFTENCKEKWWSFFLYINNYVKPDNVCMGHLWYLAVDMQFFLISPLILYPLVKKPKVGFAIWSVLFFWQIASPAVIIAVNKYTTALDAGQTLEETLDIFRNLYAVAYARGGSWLIGVLFGYIIATKGSDFNKITIYIGWICSLVSFTFCTLGMKSFQGKDYVYKAVWESVYGSLSRPLWAASVAWIVLVCVHGYGGPINTFLSLPIFIPFGKLSYCMYLVHVVLQGMLTFASRTPHYFTDFNTFKLFLTSFVLSAVIAFFCSLLFESPILTLEKMIFRRQKVDKRKSTELLEDIEEEK
ncbi:O-acyltransferase like protein-like isoform X2 [Belonocnema kinseyi]|uniref:O-acyltransferase like protein-like isoform X2 n=1 Tax=Belonocnema kinseyi TaxID=2817044 RepID=UPI00143CD4BB|nr:O-acyltransferase like protein-like isoform X2 [Belonocnema kinseyi]